ncbi:unnamed protein product [Ambrosiozyma monospora]|uniref:Unnamed protein product n=1 Tax=Ambrosiozyma monospora TaxID=43982 RepID=A0ACB5TDF6_AMBMO|nr:unnamed protein product [Ambrosiozyma monospora]
MVLLKKFTACYLLLFGLFPILASTEPAFRKKPVRQLVHQDFKDLSPTVTGKKSSEQIEQLAIPDYNTRNATATLINEPESTDSSDEKHDSNSDGQKKNGKEEHTNTDHISGNTCTQNTFDIRSEADLEQISKCAKIKGDVVVEEYEGSLLELEGVAVIEGSLTIKNSGGLSSIEAPELQVVTGTLALDTLTSLSSLSFPKLMDIDSIEWKVLPILSHANFNRGIKKIKSVVMQDTSLTGFVGFNVEKLNRLNINNNRFLERIDSTVKEVDGELVIAANSKGLKVVLSDLEYAEKVVIKDADEVDIGKLENVKQSAEFINNKFTELDVSHLKEVGASLSISKNANLKKADFSSLSDVGGGLIVIDNMELNKIDCFPSLKTIGGAIEFHGDIEESSLQQLRLVKGSAIVKSSSSSFDCKNWIENQVSDVVRGGKIECGSGNSKNEG